MTPPTDPPGAARTLTFTVGAGQGGRLDPGVQVTVTVAVPAHPILALTDNSRAPHGPHATSSAAYWHDGQVFLRPVGPPATLLNRFAARYLLGETRPTSDELSRLLTADLTHLHLIGETLYEQADEPVLEAQLSPHGPRLHVAHHALSRVSDRPGQRFRLDRPDEARAWLRTQILTQPDADQPELLRRLETLRADVTVHRPDLLQYGQPRRYLVPVTVTYTAPLSVLAADGPSAYHQGQQWGDQYSQTRDPRGCAQVDQGARLLGHPDTPPCELRLPQVHLALRDGALHVTQAGRTWSAPTGPLHLSGPTLLAAGALLFLHPGGPEDLRALLHLTPDAQHALSATLGADSLRLAHRAARGLLPPEQHRALTADVQRILAAPALTLPAAQTGGQPLSVPA